MKKIHSFYSLCQSIGHSIGNCKKKVVSGQSAEKESEFPIENHAHKETRRQIYAPKPNIDKGK